MSTVNESIKNRYSALSFSAKEIDESTLKELFEAARWSASCFNEQPWNFIFASQSNKANYDRILNCLAPFNQAWAKSAPVLMISVASLKFTINQKNNTHAIYDLGQAMANLAIKSTDLGLSVHQMAGFDPNKAKQDLKIPDDFQAICASAIGYPDSTDKLDGELKKRAEEPRSRKELNDFVFENLWGNTCKL